MRKWIAILSLCLCSLNVFGDQEACLERVEAYGSVTEIELSNGMVFHWTPDEVEKAMLDQWKPGDPIGYASVSKGFILFNFNSDIFYGPLVSMSPETRMQLPQIVAISREEDQGVLVLSDGTHWALADSEDVVSGWLIGDVLLKEFSASDLVERYFGSEEDEDDYDDETGFVNITRVEQAKRKRVPESVYFTQLDL